MNKVLAILLVFGFISPAFGDDTASFVQGFSQALQRQIEVNQGQQPPQVIYIQTPQESVSAYDPYMERVLQLEQQQLDTQRQQLQEQQNSNAWYNK